MLENNAKQKTYLRYGIIAICIAVIGLIVWRLDWDILFFIQNHIRCEFLDVIVPFYTSLGEDGIIWIALGVIMLIPKKTRKCGIMVLGALLTMLVINNIILKNLIARPRPCWSYPEMLELVHMPSSYSFPSGHTVSAFAVAFVVFSQHKKLGIVTLIMAAIMGLTRLYVFVHFPSDVYGGIIVGFAIACIVCFAEKKISAYIEKRKEAKAQ